MNSSQIVLRNATVTKLDWSIFNVRKSKITNYNNIYKTQVVYLNLTSPYPTKVHNPLNYNLASGAFQTFCFTDTNHSED